MSCTCCSYERIEASKKREVEEGGGRREEEGGKLS